MDNRTQRNLVELDPLVPSKIKHKFNIPFVGINLSNTDENIISHCFISNRFIFN